MIGYCNKEQSENFTNGSSQCVVETLDGIFLLLAVIFLALIWPLKRNNGNTRESSLLAMTEIGCMAILACMPLLSMLIILGLGNSILLSGAMIFAAIAALLCWFMGIAVRLHQMCFKVQPVGGPSLPLVALWTLQFIMNSVFLAAPRSEFSQLTKKKQTQVLAWTIVLSVAEYLASLILVIVGWIDLQQGRKAEKDCKLENLQEQITEDLYVPFLVQEPCAYTPADKCMESIKQFSKYFSTRPDWMKSRTSDCSHPLQFTEEHPGARSTVESEQDEQGWGSLNAFWRIKRKPKPSSSPETDANAPPKTEATTRPHGKESVLNVFTSRSVTAAETTSRVPSYLPVYSVSVVRWKLSGIEDLNEATTEEAGENVLGNDEEEKETKVEMECKPLTRQSSFPAPSKLPVQDGAGSKTDTVSACRDRNPPKLMFEIAVRCNRHGELDWIAANAGSQQEERASLWIVWRTAQELLDLYQFMEIKFGPVFQTKLRRPSFRTLAASTPLHQMDISSDMKVFATYLRTLLGNRQYLCLELINFLTPPQPERIAQSEENLPEPNPSPTRTGTADEYIFYLRELWMRMTRNAPLRAFHFRLLTLENVVPGHEVVDFLINSGECTDEDNAQSLARTLIERGMLVPVCLGFREPTEEGQALVIEGAPNTRNFIGTRGPWLYSYQTDTSPVFPQSSLGLFSRQVFATIPAFVMENDHTEYILHVVTGEESWEIKHRYKEFVELQKRLRRLGLIPNKQVPNKRFLKKRSNKFDNAFLEERRVGLEGFIQAVAQLAAEAPHNIGNLLMNFLDPETISALDISQNVLNAFETYGTDPRATQEAHTFRRNRG